MHERRVVDNAAIAAWYHLYGRKFAGVRLDPERSQVDLVRAASLWMRASRAGGAPAFPEEYSSALHLPQLGQMSPQSPSAYFGIGAVLFVAGVIALFVDARIGSVLLVSAAGSFVVGYLHAGGRHNAALMAADTDLFRTEGRPVLEWHRTQSTSEQGTTAPRRGPRPDFGLLLEREGLVGQQVHILYDVPLTDLMRTDTGVWTLLANIVIDDGEYAASFDFPPAVIRDLVGRAPVPPGAPLRECLKEAAPGTTIELSTPLYLTLSVHLGPPQRSPGEQWRPLLVERVLECRR